MGIALWHHHPERTEIARQASTQPHTLIKICCLATPSSTSLCLHVQLKIKGFVWQSLRDSLMTVSLGSTVHRGGLQLLACRFQGVMGLDSSSREQEYQGLPWVPILAPYKCGVGVHHCNPNPWEVEAGGSKAQHHSQIHREFETCFGYRRSCQGEGGKEEETGTKGGREGEKEREHITAAPSSMS